MKSDDSPRDARERRLACILKWMRQGPPCDPCRYRHTVVSSSHTFFDLPQVTTVLGRAAATFSPSINRVANDWQLTPSQETVVPGFLGHAEFPRFGGTHSSHRRLTCFWQTLRLFRAQIGCGMYQSDRLVMLRSRLTFGDNLSLRTRHIRASTERRPVFRGHPQKKGNRHGKC